MSNALQCESCLSISCGFKDSKCDTINSLRWQKPCWLISIWHLRFIQIFIYHRERGCGDGTEGVMWRQHRLHLRSHCPHRSPSHTISSSPAGNLEYILLVILAPKCHCTKVNHQFDWINLTRGSVASSPLFRTRPKAPFQISYFIEPRNVELRYCFHYFYRLRNTHQCVSIKYSGQT